MSKIEWTDITRNPIKGKCPTACPFCYARAMYDDNRWDPSIRFRPEVLDDITSKPCRVFVGSTIELFLFPQWLPDRCRQHPQHNFIFLTKQPQELPKWSPFPDNFDIGVSATTEEQYFEALKYLGAMAEDHDLYWEDMSTLRQELPKRSHGDQWSAAFEARVGSGGGH